MKKLVKRELQGEKDRKTTLERRLEDVLKTYRGETPEEVRNLNKQELVLWLQQFIESMNRSSVELAKHLVLLVEAQAGNVQVLKQAVRPGTGVLVENLAGQKGIVTAAHVLRREGNTTDHGNIGIIPVTPSGSWESRVLSDWLPWHTVGYENTEWSGPDIAWVPVSEWLSDRLEEEGKMFYSPGESERRIHKLNETEGEEKSIVWVAGVRDSMTQIHKNANPGLDGMIVGIWTGEVKVSNEEKDKEGWDYISCKISKTEEDWMDVVQKSLVTQETEDAIENVERMGMTREGWGGISGSGVWEMKWVLDGRRKKWITALRLCGIIFYADNQQGVLRGHGASSIDRVANVHSVAPRRVHLI